jgi:5-methylthioadenosine/S-adenosylhomocysteine deaminase
MVYDMSSDSPIYFHNAAYVVTPLDLHSILVLGHVNILVEEGVIRCIGGENDCRPPRNAAIIDSRNLVITPAYINGHTHAGMMFLKGSLPDHEFWILWNLKLTLMIMFYTKKVNL